MGSAASKPASTYVPQEVSEKENVQVVTSSFASLSLASPQSADGTLSASSIADWEEQITETPSVELARTILNHTDVKQALINRKAVVTDQHVFNTELKFKTGPITNQKSSGRCWLFATTNVLRYNVMKKFNLDDFQLSQVRDKGRCLACFGL
jgi:bleomycin hydrolase